MKKLDKETLAQRDDIKASLEVKFSDLEASVEGFNTKMDEAWKAVAAAVEDYNAKLEDEWGNGLGPVIESYNESIADANEWRQGVAQSIQEYMDDRSEKWQEGEAAQRYAVWRDEFDHEFSAFDAERPDDLEIAEPDEITYDNLDDVAEALGELPEELDAGG